MCQKQVYNVYARCIVTLARVYLNEGRNHLFWQTKKPEFEQAKNSLLEFAKTPFYDAQRYEI